MGNLVQVLSLHDGGGINASRSPSYGLSQASIPLLYVAKNNRVQKSIELTCKGLIPFRLPPQ